MGRVWDNHSELVDGLTKEFEEKYFGGEPRAILQITITWEEYIKSTLLPDAFFGAIEDAGWRRGYVLNDKANLEFLFVDDIARYEIIMTFTNPKGAL